MLHTYFPIYRSQCSVFSAQLIPLFQLQPSIFFVDECCLVTICILAYKRHSQSLLFAIFCILHVNIELEESAEKQTSCFLFCVFFYSMRKTTRQWKTISFSFQFRKSEDRYLCVENYVFTLFTLFIQLLLHTQT